MKRWFLVVFFSVFASGCGTTTLRLAAGPELDSEGSGGFDVMLGLGIGSPLDFMSRSHHFVQLHADAGGGKTGQRGDGQFSALAGGDYIYWAEPRLVMRTGVLFGYRAIWDDSKDGADLFGIGGHLALLPIVKTYDGGPIIMLLNLGPDVRVLSYGSDGKHPGGATFSIPLTAEINILAVGD